MVEKYYLLCTGASLYAPYSLTLISNKFWMRGGVVGVRVGTGESVGEKLGAELEGENKRGGKGGKGRVSLNRPIEEGGSAT
jgi:hypothetical protein